MKNGLLASTFIIVLGFCCHLGLPWWSIAPIAAIASVIFPQSPGLSFSTAFAAGTFVWWSSAFFLDLNNAGLLSAKIGQLFLGLKPAYLLMITGSLGGILAGLGGLTGSFLRSVIFPPQQKRYRGKRTTYKI
jgi:hypothetical protein